MTMITPSYLGETIEYSSLHACRSTLEDPTIGCTEYGMGYIPGWAGPAYAILLLVAGNQFLSFR